MSKTIFIQLILALALVSTINTAKVSYVSSHWTGPWSATGNSQVNVTDNGSGNVFVGGGIGASADATVLL
jgi:hypothetical protein